PGNMRTGGPTKTAAQLKGNSEAMTEVQRELYGNPFKLFSTSLNAMQANGVNAERAAARIIEISKRHPAPIRATGGQDADEIPQMVKEKTDLELDGFKMKLLGLDTMGK